MRCVRHDVERIELVYGGKQHFGCPVCKKERTKRNKKPRTQEQRKRYYAELKLRALAGYGSICACCGEAHPKFLTIDHVGGDGNADRATNGNNSAKLYLRLIREQFPASFQVLCWNCNCARAHNGGVCPHKEEV